LLFGGSALRNLAVFQPVLPPGCPAGAVEGPVLVVHQVERHVLRGQVDQAGLRVEGHGCQLCAPKGRDRVEGFVGRARSGFRWAAVLVVARGPVHVDEVLGRDELAVGAVDHEEEAVLGRVQDDLARLAVDGEVGQDHGWVEV
jgi:hypothetical protein